MKALGLLTTLGIAIAAAPALAVPVAWTDWTSSSVGQVDGTITTVSGAVDVTFTGDYSFAQTAGGIFYWNENTPAPYTSGDVDNAPPDTDIIGLDAAGTVTITFSRSVHNPIIALVSWNGNTGTFSDPIEIVSEGNGHWGTGSFGNVTANSFVGVGELHGVIRVLGDYTQVSFTHTSENWHGIQVGVEAVPVPLPLALLGTGVAALAVAGRRKRA
jgi:hypothetical protein